MFIANRWPFAKTVLLVGLSFIVNQAAKRHVQKLKRRCEIHMPRLRKKFGDEAAEDIFWLTVKTHLWSNELFWEPLFRSVCGRNPLPGVQSSRDNRIWELIIPLGSKALQDLEKGMPSHGGHLPNPIPILIPLPPRARID